MQGIFLDVSSVSNQDLDFTALDRVAAWTYYDTTSPEEIMSRIQDAEIVISNKVILDRSMLEAASKLKLICVAATGTNNVDLEAARHRNINVCNVTGYATPSVVQHVFMLILALLRQLPAYTQAVQAGHWHSSPHFCLLDYTIEELNDKLLGIIGYGELGMAVARMAEAFGMQVVIARRDADDARPGRISLEELLVNSDVVSLHCPLTEQTRGLITAARLALMKPSALLINTARGGIVDEAALLEALTHHRLAGAGIDVLAVEPPTAESPLLQTVLPNLIVTPHIAWASRAARQRLLDQVARNIENYQAGTLSNQVV